MRKGGNRQVAKIVTLELLNEHDQKLARQEAELLRQLQHPNIVRFRDSFVHRCKLYIVMDFASRGDLAGHIKDRRGAAFDEDKVWNWFIQMCLALKYMHDKRMLHRDLKPANVFVDDEGRVQLGDMGIAKVLAHTADVAKTQCGTPLYVYIRISAAHSLRDPCCSSCRALCLKGRASHRCSSGRRSWRPVSASTSGSLLFK